MHTRTNTHLQIGWQRIHIQEMHRAGDETQSETVKLSKFKKS